LENAANNQEDHRRWSVFSRGSDICRIWAEGALFGLAKTTVALFAMSQVRSRKVRHRILQADMIHRSHSSMLSYVLGERAIQQYR
jgi:hypothetical protein